MEVVNKNVESKNNILGYLKSIEVNSYNIHEEIELDNYIASMVMIITNSSSILSKNKEYSVYLLLQDKRNNKIYGEFLNKKFNIKEDAEKYYTNLLNFTANLIKQFSQNNSLIINDICDELNDEKFQEKLNLKRQDRISQRKSRYVVECGII